MFNYIAPAATVSTKTGTKTVTKTCPAMAWDVIRQPNDDGTFNVAGMAWFVDGSGASRVRGTMAANGDFTGSLTRVTKGGPTGKLAGRRSADGSIDFTLNGQGCSHIVAHVPPGVTQTQ
jgi:hypothetical protein